MGDMQKKLARVLLYRKQPPSSSLLQGAQSALFFRPPFLPSARFAWVPPERL